MKSVFTRGKGASSGAIGRAESGAGYRTLREIRKSEGKNIGVGITREEYAKLIEAERKRKP